MDSKPCSDPSTAYQSGWSRRTGCTCRVPVPPSRRTVEAAEEEVDHAVQFASVLLLGQEVIHVHHQDPRELDGGTFVALLPLLTSGERRFLVAIKHLLLDEGVEAGL